MKLCEVSPQRQALGEGLGDPGLPQGNRELGGQPECSCGESGFPQSVSVRLWVPLGFGLCFRCVETGFGCETCESQMS